MDWDVALPVAKGGIFFATLGRGTVWALIAFVVYFVSILIGFATYMAILGGIAEYMHQSGFRKNSSEETTFEKLIKWIKPGIVWGPIFVGYIAIVNSYPQLTILWDHVNKKSDGLEFLEAWPETGA